MKSILTLALLSLILVQGSASAGEFKVFRANSIEIARKDVPTSVSNLIDCISKSDMNRILLSEDKNVRWLITKVEILTDDLIHITLSDGNGIEAILCDYSPKKEWSIIRRTPIGDWKPAMDRRGDRLTVIPLLNPKAEQAVSSDGHKPSNSAPSSDTTAPADAH